MSDLVFTIKTPGEYRTRDGRKAMVLEISGPFAFGRIISSEGFWHAWRWDLTGATGPPNSDIVDVWTDPKIPWEGWVDVTTNETATDKQHIYVRQVLPAP